MSEFKDKRCPKCAEQFIMIRANDMLSDIRNSIFSRYEYCPMCGAKLEEFEHTPRGFDIGYNMEQK